MVNRKNLKIKYALISVYNKINLSYLCKNLKRHNINFISTGSTCKKIKNLGFSCQEISSLTKFKEILDGKHDALPEQAFYMVGTIEEAVEKAQKLSSGS